MSGKGIDVLSDGFVWSRVVRVELHITIEGSNHAQRTQSTGSKELTNSYVSI